MQRGKQEWPAVSTEVAQQAQPAIGISSCLLGQAVRYDGGHKRHAWIADVLSEVFEFRPVCPEVAIGLGAPRPPIQLVGDASEPRAVGVDDPEQDVTAPLRAYGREIAGTLGAGISGYILKAKSPSCGISGIPVHRAESGAPDGEGTGLYAREIMTALPLLPVVEEIELQDHEARVHFAERVFAYHRWQQLVAAGPTRAGLAHFHAIHRLTLMAHHADLLKELEQLVAAGERWSLETLIDVYSHRFMAALAQPSTRKRRTAVLEYLLGFLERRMASEELNALREAIAEYQDGGGALAELLEQFRESFRQYPDPFVTEQVYLYPPAGLTAMQRMV